MGGNIYWGDLSLEAQLLACPSSCPATEFRQHFWYSTSEVATTAPYLWLWKLSSLWLFGPHSMSWGLPLREDLRRLWPLLCKAEPLQWQQWVEFLPAFPECSGNSLHLYTGLFMFLISFLTESCKNQDGLSCPTLRTSFSVQDLWMGGWWMTKRLNECMNGTDLRFMKNSCIGDCFITTPCPFVMPPRFLLLSQ